MKKSILLLASITILFMSCNQTKKEESVKETASKNDVAVVSNQQKGEAYNLMKTNCYACHNPNTKSHDDIIAPPFKAVKMHYTREYNNKKDFVDAVVNWVQNPEEDKSLMFGAVKRFKVMPKLPLPNKDLEKIAAYIYDNDVEEPEWMGEHMKEMEGKGMMDGKGKGKGKGMNNKN